MLVKIALTNLYRIDRKRYRQLLAQIPSRSARNNVQSHNKCCLYSVQPRNTRNAIFIQTSKPSRCRWIRHLRRTFHHLVPFHPFGTQHCICDWKQGGIGSTDNRALGLDEWDECLVTRDQRGGENPLMEDGSRKLLLRLSLQPFGLSQFHLFVCLWPSHAH